MSRLFRQHRGTLIESLETTVVVESKEDIRAIFPYIKEETIRVEFYANDPRIPWPDTHIVTVGGYGVLGFTDGPLE